MTDNDHHDAPSDAKKPARLTWPALKRASHVNNTYSYPFLTVDSHMDLALIRILLAERPYKAQYGSMKESWESCAKMLQDQKDGNNNPLFTSEVQGKAVKKRFDNYILFVKEENTATPFRSGCDDEEAPCEQLVGLEDLYEDYTSYLTNTESNKESIAAKKLKDKNDGNSVREASLNGYTRPANNLNDTDSNTRTSLDDESALNLPPPRKKSRGSATSTATHSTSGFKGSKRSILDGIKEIEVFATEREERKLEKAKYKKERLKQKSEELSLQQQRLQMDRELQDQRLELERERMRLESHERRSNSQLVQSVVQLLTVQAQAQSMSQSSSQSISLEATNDAEEKP